VFDSRGRTLPDIDVEIMDDLYRPLPNGRVKTDSTGRYFFANLRDGRYYVRAYGYRYDLEDQMHMVEIITQSIRGTEGVGAFTQDFYLQPKKGGLAAAELAVIFSQEIPSEAKKAYEKATEALSKRQIQQGISELLKAIEIFPDYYYALHLLGKELFMMKKYKEAVPYLLKAVEINQKSAASLYYLGYSLHMLGKEFNRSALIALKEAHLLAPSSVQILYVLGKIKREMGEFQESENYLLKAKKLSKEPIPEIQKELSQLYANDLKRYEEAARELALYLKVAGLTDAERKEGEKVVENLKKKAKETSKN
jgi:tetratricopeptide (TPR) repeat protein